LTGLKAGFSVVIIIELNVLAKIGFRLVTWIPLDVLTVDVMTEKVNIKIVILYASTNTYIYFYLL
jgi:hypothetical protein